MKTNALLAICLLIIAAISPAVQAQPASEQAMPPNIVWLTTEDMSPWLACYGDSTVPTPNIDKLAQQSIKYQNAFANSPVCAPARSTLITGMYATRIGTMQHRTSTRIDEIDLKGYEGVPPTFVRCFPEHLRAAGYYCTNNNKQDYQFNAPVGVWDASGNGAHYRKRPEGKPFFAVFNYFNTHESQGFPNATRHADVIKPEDVPIPPFYPGTPAVRDVMTRTYNNIAALDAWVGDRLKELEDRGLLDNTIVFFFSDHGVGLPRGKRSCYDTGTRVPLLVRFPDGQGAGTTDTRVTSFVDLGPTVLSLAGIKPDDRLDGTPFLGEHAREGTGYSFANADRFDEVYDRSRTVSDGRFRYIRNYRTDLPFIIRNGYRENLPMTAELYALQESGPQRPEQWQVAATERPAEEFYDSQADYWEVNNLIDDPAHTERIAAMRQALDSWIEDTGDLGFVDPEIKLVRDVLYPPNGEKPETAFPDVSVKQVDTDHGTTRLVSITCDTQGASIAFRLSKDWQSPGPWLVYTGSAFEVDPSLPCLEVDAHRIGYKPTRARVELSDH